MPAIGANKEVRMFQERTFSTVHLLKEKWSKVKSMHNTNIKNMLQSKIINLKFGKIATHKYSHQARNDPVIKKNEQNQQR
jgi:hypothetical protein